MSEKEKQIAERYRNAQTAWQVLMATNVASISIERQIELDLRIERARQELADAGFLYQKMLSDRVRRERMN